ncbi:hypothetical protein SASPL_148267 [Salvia splendens]|uniref:Uncharacterized protein n=1 Tax=Salvia splendens TaxID=180675 RepID=A0A8X8W9Y7_SALSN|nr:hypothetical protein SASPL_148267 [Salvia splendens]
MSKRRMNFASNSRERKLARRNPNQQEEEEAPIPAQDLLFEKKLTFSDATGSQLTITGAYRETLMAFLTDAETKKVEEIGGGLMVPTRVANVRYELELKRNSTTYFNKWGPVASANKFKVGNSVQGFGYRDGAGEFRLNLSVIRNPNQQQEEAPIPENPNQHLLFEKKLTATETANGRLLITGAHRATVLGFLTVEERQDAEKDGVGVKVPTRDGNGNGARYELELKRNKKLNNVYLMGWQEVARAITRIPYQFHFFHTPLI